MISNCYEIMYFYFSELKQTQSYNYQSRNKTEKHQTCTTFVKAAAYADEKSLVKVICIIVIRQNNGRKVKKNDI